MRWTLGHNVPGYLPESDVVDFDGTADDAAAAVWDDAYSAYESAMDAHASHCPHCAVDSSIFPRCDSRPFLSSHGGTDVNARGATDVYLCSRSAYDLGVHYWAVTA